MYRFVEEALSKIWGDYNLYAWVRNTYFSSFLGAEIRAFISNTPLVTLFLKEYFFSYDYLDSGYSGLDV